MIGQFGGGRVWHLANDVAFFSKPLPIPGERIILAQRTFARHDVWHDVDRGGAIGASEGDVLILNSVGLAAMAVGLRWTKRMSAMAGLHECFTISSKKSVTLLDCWFTHSKSSRSYFQKKTQTCTNGGCDVRVTFDAHCPWQAVSSISLWLTHPSSWRDVEIATGLQVGSGTLSTACERYQFINGCRA